MFLLGKKVTFGEARRVHALLIAMLPFLISACTAPLPGCPPGDSPAAEAKARRDQQRFPHGTAGDVSRLINTRAEFHDAVLSPLSYTAPYPLYLVGIEKPRDNAGSPYSAPGTAGRAGHPVFKVSNLHAGAADRKDIEAVLDDRRPMVLTHVLSVRQSNPVGETTHAGCFVYNVYQDENSARWCRHRHPIKVEPGKGDWTSEGWKGLDQLGQELAAAVKREHATHIIVLATGWNTAEYESFLDFGYWMKQLAKDFEGKADFRPIFVGIPWESAWQSPLWTALPFGSWSVKGNDADAIGFTWANYLLNDVLKPIALGSGARLVAIGHSFGSRIVLGAHYARDIIVRQPGLADTLPVTVIGLQAAFPTGRFTLTEGREHEYAAAQQDSAAVAITTSRLDKATRTIGFGTAYIGGPGGLETLDAQQSAYRSSIALPVFRTNESGQPATPPAKNLVSVYDATPFVNCELPDTASGAHSDVYDQEMGHFLGEIIRAPVK